MIIYGKRIVCQQMNFDHIQGLQSHSTTNFYHIQHKSQLEKYTELRAGIKQLYKSPSVKQINVVFDFLGGFHEELKKDLRNLTNTDKELTFLIERCQKWIICQNANIVKTFYEYT